MQVHPHALDDPVLMPLGITLALWQAAAVIVGVWLLLAVLGAALLLRVFQA